MDNANIAQTPQAAVDYSVVQLAESSGVHLISEGKSWTGNCPFHADASESLCIDPQTNHWQCDGDCQAGGGAVEWVMKAKGVSRTHAIELLKSEYPVSMSVGEPVQRTTVRELDAPFDAGDDDQTVLARVIGYYHRTLKQSPEALEYLKSRCIDNPEALEHFKLGFSNRTLGYHLPAKNRKEGAALRGHLQRLGIIRSNGHEHFRGSIVVPIINDGVIHQVYGRKIASKLRPDTPQHCTLPEAL